MSKENTQPTSTSKYSLVRAIVTLFKLGDEGKVENFFVRQRRTLERDIEKLQKEMDLDKFNHKQELEDLDDQLVDGEAAVSDAYLQIDASQLVNNVSSDNFADEYWRTILRREANLKSIKEAKEKLEEAYEEKLENNKKEIAERKRRLSRISAEKDA